MLMNLAQLTRRSLRDFPANQLKRPLVSLARDRSASSLIEFAYVMPVLLTVGMYGTEVAYMATVNMQLSQVAMALADNASRLGQTDNSAVSPTIRNADVDSVMAGAITQGDSINLQANGRVILSSLERDPATGRQYIHWQKCRGTLVKASAYGPKKFGLSGTTLTGMGKSRPVVASSTTGVMFVEAFYAYKPLFGKMFVNNVNFSHEAAFMVRDDREYGPSSGDGVPASPAGSSECS